jgi:hypothetical protein
MKQQEYMFTIGFSGNTAIVDGAAMKKYGKLGFDELVGQGLYKPALGAAFFSGDTEALNRIVVAYNSAAGTNFEGPDQIMRVFGLEPAPENLEKVKILS